MTKTERELAQTAQMCGYTIARHPHGQYFVRTWDGASIGPMTPRDARMWLAGCSFGQYAHEPKCQCGRVACVHRNAVTGVKAP